MMNHSYTHIEEAPEAKEQDIQTPPQFLNRRRSSNYIDALSSKRNEESDPISMDMQNARHQLSSIEQSDHDSKTSNCNKVAEEDEVDYMKRNNHSRQQERPLTGRRRSSFEYEDFKKNIYNRSKLFK